MAKGPPWTKEEEDAILEAVKQQPLIRRDCTNRWLTPKSRVYWAQIDLPASVKARRSADALYLRYKHLYESQCEAEKEKEEKNDEDLLDIKKELANARGMLAEAQKLVESLEFLHKYVNVKKRQRNE